MLHCPDICQGSKRAHLFEISLHPINPALTHGIAHQVGSIEVGKLADLVLWEPKFFGVKPEIILKGPASLSLSFVSNAAYENGLAQQLGLQKQLVPVRNCRNVGKKDLIHNQLLPHIEVNPETYEVKADGQILTCEPASVLPMAQRYFLF